MKKPKPATPPYPFPLGSDPHAPEDWGYTIRPIGSRFYVTVGSGFIRLRQSRATRSLKRAERIGDRMLRRTRRQVDRELRNRIALARTTGDWREVPPRYRPQG